MWVALISPYPIACTRNTEMMLILFEIFFLPFAYLQYLSRYTIHVDKYLKTHLLIFFRENSIQGVCE